MLRLLLLGLLLTLTALKPLTADPDEGSGDFATDDDELDDVELAETSSGTGDLGEEFTERGNSQKQGSKDEDGTTTIIIIAAVSVVALTIVAVLAVLLFRRHLKNREQGVYAVPVDQVEKGGI
ncbi:uncharacterized protein si:dkey-262k9.2 [Astyanax mexicanus]|uniref:uncharacterized protein si:dkey-262k9.2 n=1 Tax=Astyanax mexicanus TaxID=7994 RepID=UPI0020CAEF96|nr:uncharacterized protein si:dkey-262k9.2 [Astyanax mexicanus]